MAQKKSHATPGRRRPMLSARSLVYLRAVTTAWVRQPLKRSGVHLATLAVGILTLSLLINFINQVIQSANLEARRTQLETEVAHIQAENAHIRSGFEYAESDVNVERVAREQLGYAREGDIVVLPRYLAPTPTLPTAGTALAPTDASTVAPNWLRWWQAFTRNDHSELP